MSSVTDKEVDNLLDEVLRPRGCRVSHIKDEKALKFIAKITLEKQNGGDPNIGRASDILKEIWSIDVPRRSLSEHARGNCSCPKTK
jgi:hypothetical protein